MLLDESTYNNSEIKEISIFLKKLLVYNPSLRLSSKQCYDNDWIKTLNFAELRKYNTAAPPNT